MSKLDLLIKGGKIIDGTGAPGFVADLGIKDGLIAKIGNLSDCQAEQVLNAEGKVVTPGFIEAHSHVDNTLRLFPESEGYLMQGVTTAISGNCGFSPAPLRAEEDVWMFAIWEWKVTMELISDPYLEVADTMDFKKVMALMKKHYNLDIPYRTMAGFMKTAESEGFSINTYPLVGHGMIRYTVMGDDFRRAATPEEIEKMKVILRGELESGCHGMSVGLDSLPGAYAHTAELIELAKVVKEYDALYASHCRGYTTLIDGDTNTKILEGYHEAIRIGKETGVRVHISHVMPEYQIPLDAPLEEKLAKAREVLKIIDDAIAGGVDLGFDVVSSDTGGVIYRSDLGYLLRPYYMKSGRSVEKLLENLENPEWIAEMKDDVKTGRNIWLSPVWGPNIDASITILRCNQQEYVGKTLRSIMQEKGWDMIDAIVNIFKADPFTHARLGLGAMFAEEWTEEVLLHPLAMPSGDNVNNNLNSDYGIESPISVYPHQNAYCYTIKYLTDLSKKMSLEEKIRHITKIPAEQFRIMDRGTLEVGKWADIVVMTPEELKTNEDFIDPRQAPDGINYVVVNGALTIENKKHTTAKAGRFI